MTTMRNRIRRLRNAEWRHAHRFDRPTITELLVLLGVVLLMTVVRP
ncbi:MAG TPA: hypothetical protein VFQ99_06890 [Gallionella sp.]|nr:hypothetical protein [Gallionella sp.]